MTRTGFEDGLFAAWRKDESFVLNNPVYADGSVLVAGPDFGTGSSREHAVWALMNWGFRVVISSRFADIFRGNSGKQGLLTAIVAQDDVELIWKYLENNPGAEITVDLVARTVHAGEIVAPFEIDDYTRWRLLEGLDDIGLTLRHEDLVAEFEASPPEPQAGDHPGLTGTSAGGPDRADESTDPLALQGDPFSYAAPLRRGQPWRVGA